MEIEACGCCCVYCDWFCGFALGTIWLLVLGDSVWVVILVVLGVVWVFLDLLILWCCLNMWLQVLDWCCELMGCLCGYSIYFGFSFWV